MDRKLRLMLVDDERVVGQRLGPSLERAGYEVEFFESGEAAIERIREASFDIVVTDVRMGQVNGIRVLDEVLERHPKTKVIIITGYATIRLAREAMAKGAFDFIAKPFQPKELKEIVDRAAAELT